MEQGALTKVIGPVAVDPKKMAKTATATPAIRFRKSAATYRATGGSKLSGVGYSRGATP